MSWIIQNLWSSLRDRKGEYQGFLETNETRAFQIVNQIAYEVGQRYRILLLLNFPPGHAKFGVLDIGHRDLSMIVSRGRERFEGVTELEVKKALEQLRPLSIEPLAQNREGFKTHLSRGRIDCLPGSIHLWCEITGEVLAVLDWLFENVYGLKPP